MNELHELKEMLCEELKKYGKKGELSAGSLEIIDKLAHSIKNIEKVIESDDYSNAYRGTRGRSYARRRDGRGRYTNDGYSRHDDMVGELRYLMDNAEDEQTRREFQRFIDKMEQM